VVLGKAESTTRFRGSFRLFSVAARASGARFPLALLALAVLGVLFGTTAARLLGAVLLVSSVLLLSSLVRDVRAVTD